jgi:hypothetical protein
VLLLPKSEAEILENILEGLFLPISRFVFQVPHCNFAEFDLLCVVDQNMAFTDSTRKIPVHSKKERIAHILVASIFQLPAALSISRS